MYKLQHIETGKFASHGLVKYWHRIDGLYRTDKTFLVDNGGKTYTTLRGANNLLEKVERKCPGKFKVVQFTKKGVILC
jgi:hypothetical protein